MAIELFSALLSKHEDSFDHSGEYRFYCMKPRQCMKTCQCDITLINIHTGIYGSKGLDQCDFLERNE